VLYYCKVPRGNFGDDLNPWLWSRLAPEVCDEGNPTLFVGIGTILSHRIPAEPVKFVFGSGWAGSRLPTIDDRWLIYCVRGPLTAARLALAPELAIADSAILVRSVSLPEQKKCHPVSFMPHHWSMAAANWRALCERAGIHCIDPGTGVDRILLEIQQTELLLAEAMHGAIVADALRVPWIPVRVDRRFQEFKWRDWTQSIGVPFNPASIPPVLAQAPAWRKRLGYALKRGLVRTGLGKERWKRLCVRASTEAEIDEALRVLQQLPRTQTPCLSADGTIREIEERLEGRLAELRTAWQKDQFAHSRAERTRG
jgi:succinoglycan biosynthesis protein ExoV